MCVWVCMFVCSVFIFVYVCVHVCATRACFVFVTLERLEAT